MYHTSLNLFLLVDTWIVSFLLLLHVALTWHLTFQMCGSDFAQSKCVFICNFDRYCHNVLLGCCTNLLYSKNAWSSYFLTVLLTDVIKLLKFCQSDKWKSFLSVLLSQFCYFKWTEHLLMFKSHCIHVNSLFISFVHYYNELFFSLSVSKHLLCSREVIHCL